MKAPNLLTVIRIIMSFVFLGVYYAGFPGGTIGQRGIFIIASLMDMVDGMVAKR